MAMTQVKLGGFINENIEAINDNFSDIQLNKADKTSVPTKVSQLTNDSDYQNRTQLAPVIKNVTMDDATGVFTFTKYDDSTFTIDTALEKVVTNFEYDDETESLVLTLEDGTKQTVPMSAFIDIYTGGKTSSGTVSVSPQNQITFNLGDKGVTLAKLADEVTAKLSTNDFTNKDKQKLDSLENYALPVAGTQLGGIKNGGNVVVSPDGTANVSLPSPGASAIKMNFTGTDSTWAQKPEIADGYWFNTLSVASQSQKNPLVVFRKNGSRYEQIVAMVYTEGNNIVIGSLDKFDGYVVVV